MTDTTGNNYSNDTTGNVIHINRKNDKMDDKKNMKSDGFNLNQETYITMREDIREIKTSLKWIMWIIPILVTIAVFVLGLFINFSNANVSTQIKVLETKIDALQQNNSMQIQRDVAQEFLKYKK